MQVFKRKTVTADMDALQSNFWHQQIMTKELKIFLLVCNKLSERIRSFWLFSNQNEEKHRKLDMCFAGGNKVLMW